MRSTTLGLSLALITGASALTLAPSTAAAPAANSRTSGEAQSANSDHVLPNPEAEKQAALRNQAWADVLSGEATPETINGSTVLKVGKKPVGSGAANARAKAKKEDQYVELGNEKTDKVFVVLAEFGNQRDPRYPDQDTDPATPGPVDLRRPAAQRRSPRPTARRQLDASGSPDYTADYYQQLYFGTARGRGVAQDATTSASPRAATASTARSPTGSRCPTTRPATAAATATRARATSAATRGT